LDNPGDVRGGAGGAFAFEPSGQLQHVGVGAWQALPPTRRDQRVEPAGPYARIQWFKLARDTVTGSPVGPMCTWAANWRTRRPRSDGDRPASVSGRISEYRYSATSRAFFSGEDIDYTSPLSGSTTVTPSTLTRRGGRSHMRSRVDRRRPDHC
jgi:hypothetical protein